MPYCHACDVSRDRCIKCRAGVCDAHHFSIAGSGYEHVICPPVGWFQSAAGYEVWQQDVRELRRENAFANHRQNRDEASDVAAKTIKLAKEAGIPLKVCYSVRSETFFRKTTQYAVNHGMGWQLPKATDYMAEQFALIQSGALANMTPAFGVVKGAPADGISIDAHKIVELPAVPTGSEKIIKVCLQFLRDNGIRYGDQ